MKNNWHVSEIFLRCDDMSEMLVVDRFHFSSEDKDDWNFSIQDSYINGDNSIWQRIKRAFKILFGKPVYYADICISGNEKIIEFRDKLTEAIESECSKDKR